MYAVTVTFTVAPSAMADFLPLVTANARASVRDEPGCLQFDVCRGGDNPETVFLYEIYSDRSAFEEHMKTSHFNDFSAATEHMVEDKQVRTFGEVIR